MFTGVCLSVLASKITLSIPSLVRMYVTVAIRVPGYPCKLKLKSLTTLANADADRRGRPLTAYEAKDSQSQAPVRRKLLLCSLPLCMTPVEGASRVSLRAICRRQMEQVLLHAAQPVELMLVRAGMRHTSSPCLLMCCSRTASPLRVGDAVPLPDHLVKAAPAAMLRVGRVVDCQLVRGAFQREPRVCYAIGHTAHYSAKVGVLLILQQTMHACMEPLLL